MSDCRQTGFLSILASLFLSSALASPGADWLATQQQSDGRFQGPADIATPYQSTAEALRAFETINGNASGDTSAALQFISNPPSGSTEHLYRQIIANTEAGGAASVLVDRLLQHQNADGGFGTFAGYDSTTLETAFALEALALAGQEQRAAAGYAVSFMFNAQRADGAWSLGENEPSVYVTALALRAVWLYRTVYNVETSVAQARDYLLARRGLQNLWGETFESALALIAVAPTLIDRGGVQSSLDALEQRQQVDGSFGNDAYQTALALRALRLAELPPPDDIRVRGRVVDGDTGLPLAGVEADLTGPDNRTLNTGNDGVFEFTGLAAGDYSLELTLGGYGPLTSTLALQTGDQRNLGELNMLPATASPTTGTVIGTVTAAADGERLAGVTVTLTGEETLSAVTNDDGRYQIANVPPGDYSAQAALSGYTTATGNATVTAGRTLIFSPALTSLADTGIVVQGAVTDRDSGAPLPEATVTVQGGGNNASAQTDTAGEYRIEALQPGELTLTASAGGYQSNAGTVTAQQNTVINFSPALVPEGGDDRPVENSGIQGVIVDAGTGDPLAGAAVTLTLAGNAYNATSDNSGAFAFTGLPAGTAELGISLDGYRPRSASLTLTDNVTLDIGTVELVSNDAPDTGLVRGTVVDSSTNESLAGVTVDAEFDTVLQSVVTGPDGAFEFQGLPDSDGQLQFSRDGYVSVNFSVSAEFSQPDLGQIRMRPEEVEELLPDLAIETIDNRSISNDLHTGALGGALNVTLRNTGTAATANTVGVLAFRDIDGDGAYTAGVDSRLGRYDMTDPIAPDGARDILIPVQGELPFRDAPIHVWLDSDQVVVESNEDNNITSTAHRCEGGGCPVVPAAGEISAPAVKWHWQPASGEAFWRYDQIVMAPIVVQLNDDNADGRTDSHDTPDVVVNTMPGRSPGYLRAIDGRTGQQHWIFTGTRLQRASSLAAADIDLDGHVEIVGTTAANTLIAVSHDGQFEWESASPVLPLDVVAGSPSIADINHDGVPEIAYANQMYSNQGELLWGGRADFYGRNNNSPQSASALSVIADIDPGPGQELIVGASAYNSEGDLLWQNDAVGDGFSAIGNLNEDTDAEIVVVGSGNVHILDRQGQILAGPVTLPGGGKGGPPTVADIDGDGQAEIGIAGASNYVVFNNDLSVAWTSPTEDFSSAATGSSVFDFNGDGSAEVAYADEEFLRIYEGSTGAVLFETPNTSTTGHELPVIADIDNDAHAEMVVVANTLGGGGISGLRVFEAEEDDWVATRAIWNQHAYHIDNINDDGSVPINPAKSWLTHNTFRLNTFPDCRPGSSVFDPVLKWQWTESDVLPDYNNVLGLPVVVPLEDTNDDGSINENDVPAIVFHSFDQAESDGGGAPGVLRAISGADGRELWSVTDAALRTESYSQIAAGDIDGDRLVEIVASAPKADTGLLVFEHTGELKWRSDEPTRRFGGQFFWGGPSLADLDRDGSPEIVVGTDVLNSDGSVYWKGSGSFHGADRHGPLSIVADINNDGWPEVVAGGSVYSHTGELQWVSARDGYTAVGNFDEDEYAEIVLISSNQAFLLEHTGDVKWGPVGSRSFSSGGPPTIADMDGDGHPEIGYANRFRYQVLNHDGSLLWSVPVDDSSSGVTGSSVFDFEGDGRAEVVYADENFLRIYDGADGSVLTEFPNMTGTVFEYPIVVDVDADNQAEIVMLANSREGDRGIRVFESRAGNWVNTRRIWNQHTYHINNINDDGTVPVEEAPSWLSHNTYRLNTFADPDRNVLALPDLTVSRLAITEAASGGTSTISARLGNGGGGAMPAGATAAFYRNLPDGGTERLGSVALPLLPPGEYAGFSLANVTGLAAGDRVTVVVDADDTVAECREDNNRMTVTATGLSGELALSLNGSAFAARTDVALTSTVTNPGTLTADYTLANRIEDTDGNSVTGFEQVSVDSVAAGAGVNLGRNWNTADTIAGEYVAVGILYDSRGNELDRVSVPLTIVGSADGAPLAELRTTTDRRRYHTTDVVQIHDLARNRSTNALIEGAGIALTVTGPGATTVLETTLEVGTLAAGNLRELQTPLPLNAAQPGAYQVAAELKDGAGVVLATGQAEFDVIDNPVLALNGTVEAQQDELFVGETQICDYSAANSGTVDRAGQPLWQVLVNVTAESEISAERVTRDLPSGSETTMIQSLATAGLEPGDYACVLQATIDGERHTLAQDVFTLTEPPINLDVAFTLGERGRLLVLLDEDHRPGCKTGDGDGWDVDDDRDRRWHDKDRRDQHAAGKRSAYYGKPHDRDDKEHPTPWKKDCRDKDWKHGHGRDEQPPLSEQRASLEQILDEAGWSYTIVTERDDFSRELRTGGYTVYALLSERVKLANTTLKELREAVFRGEGLLVAGAHDRRNSKIDPALGVKFVGHQKAAGLDVPESDFHAAANESLQHGKVRRMHPETAQTLAVFTGLHPEHDDGYYWKGHGCDKDRHDEHRDRDDGKDRHKKHGDRDRGNRHDDTWGKAGYGKNGPDDKWHHHPHCEPTPDTAIAGNDYGQGRAVTMGFDLLREAAAGESVGPTGLFDSLLLASLDDVHPEPLQPVVGDVLPLHLSVENLGIATPGRAVVTLPPETDVLDAGAAAFDEQAQHWQWPFDLSAGATAELGMQVRPPYTDSGTAAFDALIQTGTAPDFLDYETVDLTVQAGVAPTVDTVLADLNAAAHADHKLKMAAWRVRKADRRLDRDRPGHALRELLKATDWLAASTHPQADALRVRVGRLIKTVARRAGGQTGPGGRFFDRFRHTGHR